MKPEVSSEPTYQHCPVTCSWVLDKVSWTAELGTWQILAVKTPTALSTLPCNLRLAQGAPVLDIWGVGEVRSPIVLGAEHVTSSVNGKRSYMHMNCCHFFPLWSLKLVVTSDTEWKNSIEPWCPCLAVQGDPCPNPQSQRSYRWAAWTLNSYGSVTLSWSPPWPMRQLGRERDTWHHHET